MNKRMCSPRLSLQLLCQNSEVKAKSCTGGVARDRLKAANIRGAGNPISARRYASNSTCRGYNPPSYLFVRPFVEVITLLLGFSPGKLKDISYENIDPNFRDESLSALSTLHPIKLVVGWLVTRSPNRTNGFF